MSNVLGKFLQNEFDVFWVFSLNLLWFRFVLFEHHPQQVYAFQQYRNQLVVDSVLDCEYDSVNEEFLKELLMLDFINQPEDLVESVFPEVFVTWKNVFENDLRNYRKVLFALRW